MTALYAFGLFFSGVFVGLVINAMISGREMDKSEFDKEYLGSFEPRKRRFIITANSNSAKIDLAMIGKPYDPHYDVFILGLYDLEKIRGIEDAIVVFAYGWNRIGNHQQIFDMVRMMEHIGRVEVEYLA